MLSKRNSQGGPSVVAAVTIYYAQLLNKWPINLLGWGKNLLQGDFQSRIIKWSCVHCLDLHPQMN